MPSETNRGRKVIAGRSIRWNDARAAQAYASGLWIDATLVDSLRHAAQHTPHRVLLVDGDRRIDCATLWSQSGALAQTLLARAPAGSVVSFLLPNWHEAAVIYLAATRAGIVVNPILPSLRDHELRFILDDAASRFVFIPAAFRQTDYPAMLSRVCAQLVAPPEVVVLRGDAQAHTPYESLLKPSEHAAALPVVDPDSVRMIL